VAVVKVHTVRPEVFERRRTPELVAGLERVLKRTVTVDLAPEAQAVHKYVRVPPQKARRVMDEVRGKYVDEALAILQFLPNRAARYVYKLVRSAAANAFEGWGAEPHELKISLLHADPGPTIKRIQPRAQGRAYRILKRSSHLTAAVQAAEPRASRRGPARRRGQAAVTRA
jgi:large subunit ribosomal protein L22